MAILEHTEAINLALEQGPDAWHAWRAEHPDVKVDQSSVNRSKQNLQGCNFDGVDFSEADFSEAKLSGCSFRGANLDGANLNSQQLIGLDFTGASMISANLDHANLHGAILRNVNLREANLSYTNLQGAELTEARLRCQPLSPACLVQIYHFLDEAEGEMGPGLMIRFAALDPVCDSTLPEIPAPARAAMDWLVRIFGYRNYYPEFSLHPEGVPKFP